MKIPKTRKITARAKKPRFVSSGPYEGQEIPLAFDGATAIFTVSGFTGRYFNGRWEDINLVPKNDITIWMEK